MLTLRFPPEPEYAEQFADTTVEAVREIQNVRLDYSPASITKLETVMCRLRDDGSVVNDIAETLFMFGCYVGEVILKSIVGVWYAPTPGRLALWTGEGDIDNATDDDMHDPILQTFEFFQAPDTQGLAAYVATIIDTPIESGVTLPPPIDVAPALLREIGMRLGSVLLAMRDKGLAAKSEPVLLKMRGDDVIDDAWADDARDVDSWRIAREDGVARALITGPGGTNAGFMSMIAMVDPGIGQCVHCAVPTLPAWRDQPFTIFDLQADDGLPQSARAEILMGIKQIDPTLVINAPPPRAVLRIEYLGPNVQREEGYLYVVTSKGVYRTAQESGGRRATKEAVLDFRIKVDPFWLYFVDQDGALARVPMFQMALYERYLTASDTERAEIRGLSS